MFIYKKITHGPREFLLVCGLENKRLGGLMMIPIARSTQPSQCETPTPFLSKGVKLSEPLIVY